MTRVLRSASSVASIALALFLCALLDGADAQRVGGRISLGPETAVSRNEDFAHVETMLAANPSDARHLLASCLGLEKGADGNFLPFPRAYVSRDAGRTWTPSPPTTSSFWDPVSAFTPAGTALLASLRPPRSLTVFRSSNGGATWNESTDLPFTDRPMIAVDWTRGKHRGRIYIAGRLGEARTDPIVVHYSDDEGRTFNTSVAVKEPIVAWALNPIVLTDGSLFLPFRTQAGRRLEQIDDVRSSDGGRSFAQPFRIATRQENATDAADTPPAVFAAGPHGGAERLYAVYIRYGSDGNGRLVISRSDDGGRTWSAGKDVAAGAAPDVTHGAANIAVNGSGVVGISWLQRTIRGGSQPGDKECERFVCFNETYDLFFTASLDGGDTFTPATRITATSSNPIPKHAGRFWPGQDYMLSAAASDGLFHLLWPDARTGIFQLYTRSVRVE